MLKTIFTWFYTTVFWISYFFLIQSLVGCGPPQTTITGYVPVPGPSGSPGPQGPAGQSIVGPQGVPGINPTPTTVIQLCGTCQAAYPQVFPEVGICVQGNLYGVYSANGGFFTLITPGAYSSDGINCSCNFTVAANCLVTQN